MNTRLSLMTLFFLSLGNILVSQGDLNFLKDEEVSPEFKFSQDAIIPGEEAAVYYFDFDNTNSLIFIDGHVEGHTGKFILDTGAEQLYLNSKYFKGVLNMDHEISGLNGRQKRRNIKVDKVEIGSLKLKNIAAICSDFSNIESSKNIKILGLIGFSILKDFKILLNCREGYVRFVKLDRNGEKLCLANDAPKKLDSIGFTTGNFIPIIPVNIKGNKKFMAIDSGAEYSLLNKKGNKNILSYFNVKGTVRVIGASGNSKAIVIGRLCHIRFAKKYVSASLPAILCSLDNLNAVYKVNLDGILGYNFLRPWVISINYKKKMIYFHELQLELPKEINPDSEMDLLFTSSFKKRYELFYIENYNYKNNE